MIDKILIQIKKFIPDKLFKTLWPIYHFLLGWFGDMFYGFPSQKLIVIGVTGTSGKTTSVYLIAQVLKQAGYKVGYTSTALFSDGEKEWLNNKKMTMVGRWFTFKLMHQMVKNKCQYAIIETSSEGILQYRHRFINYDLLVFTNLYPEHLEAHGGFENYKEAKGLLFAHLRDCATKYIDEQRYVQKIDTEIKKLNFKRVKKTIIVNGDDQHSDYFLNFWAEEKIKYKIEHEEKIAEKKRDNYQKIVASNVRVNRDGTSFNIEGVEINLSLLGEFNVANAMNAISVALAENISLEDIKTGLENVVGIPGRLEVIQEGQDFTVLVDYAFEPQAVEKLYQTIALIPHQKVIHVLGSAGGGRDKSRRPVLGKLAGEKADKIIVTNEDPYDEDPEKIITEVVQGVQATGKELNQDLFKIMDRREAIKKALQLARFGDIILITGKGSEQAICIKDGHKIPWDDRKVVREELQKLQKNS